MHAEDIVIHDSGQSKEVKDLAAVAPHIERTIFAQAFIVESINLGDLPRLMVATNEDDLIRVANFQRQEKEEGFNAVVATIDKVAQEEVVCLGNIAPHFEELHQVVELTMDIPANLRDWWSMYRNRGINADNIFFVVQNVFSFGAKDLDLCFTKDFPIS